MAWTNGISWIQEHTMVLTEEDGVLPHGHPMRDGMPDGLNLWN